MEEYAQNHPAGGIDKWFLYVRIQGLRIFWGKNVKSRLQNEHSPGH
jgi:hypothetical protein